MGRSQQTFNKSEREKKRLKKREEKKKKMEARKLEAKENGKKGIEFAYVGHDGQLTDTPPDPSKKIRVNLLQKYINPQQNHHELQVSRCRRPSFGFEFCGSLHHHRDDPFDPADLQASGRWPA